VTKPTKETRDDEMVDLPDGWVRCDGATIPHPSVWAGQLTPNLNGEKRFLRGSSDLEMLTMEDEKTRLPDHTHNSKSKPHTHSYTDTYLSDQHCDMASGSYWCIHGNSKTTGSTTVDVEVQGVSNHGEFDDETRPKNMHVIYIMRVF